MVGVAGSILRRTRIRVRQADEGILIHSDAHELIVRSSW
jgi:hypothetical protein